MSELKARTNCYKDQILQTTMLSNHILKLEQLVKKAYLEGAKDAFYYGNNCQSDVCGFSEEMWRNSDSKKELGTTE